MLIDKGVRQSLGGAVETVDVVVRQVEPVSRLLPWKPCFLEKRNPDFEGR